MLLGRPIALWDHLVLVVAAAYVAVAAWMGNSIPSAVVSAVIAVVLAALGMLANQAVTGTMLGRKP